MAFVVEGASLGRRACSCISWLFEFRALREQEDCPSRLACLGLLSHLIADLIFYFMLGGAGEVAGSLEAETILQNNSDCIWMLVQVLIALLVRGFTCQQPDPTQSLAANVSERDDIVSMNFAAKQ